MRYRVIIVEDDPMVAAIDRQYVESDPAFRVERVFCARRAVSLRSLAFGRLPGIFCWRITR